MNMRDGERALADAVSSATTHSSRRTRSHVVRSGTVAMFIAAGLMASVARAQSITPLAALPVQSVDDFCVAIAADGLSGLCWGQDFVIDRWTPRHFRWRIVGGGVGTTVLAYEALPLAGRAISGDGLVVIGEASMASGGAATQEFTRAMRWSAADGLLNLGMLPGLPYAAAYGVNGDGSVVVGASNGAFEWTAAGGMRSLGPVVAGLECIAANAVSRDGLVVTGDAQDADGNQRIFLWTRGGGMEAIGYNGRPFGLSADGSVVVGSHNDKAFRWTRAGGFENLGALPGDTAGARATEVSDDGSVVLGLSLGDGRTRGIRPFIWTEAGGMLELGAYLSGVGIDLTGWTLSNVTGISGDGRSITGNGVLAGVSQRKGFIVQLGGACFTLSLPAAATTCPNGSVSVAAAVQGAPAGAIGYQWQYKGGPTGLADWLDLTDGANVVAGQLVLNASGAGTSVLTVDRSLLGWPAADAGQLRCIATNSCGSVASNAAALRARFACSIADLAHSGTCPDGVVDGSDFIAFINSYAAGDPATDALADVNGDLITDGNDFVAFINAYVEGC